MEPVFTKDAALIIVDMLNDFILEGAPLEVPKARDIIANVREAKRQAKAAGVPVIYVCDAHRKDDPEFQAWPVHCVAGTPGAQMVAGLEPAADDIVLAKRRYSGFFGTDLDLHLRERGVKRTVICGILTDICVYHTAADARQRDYEVVVLKDAVAALSDEDHSFALKQMQRLFGAQLAEDVETADARR